VVIFNKIKRSPSARAIGERMKTNLNRIGTKHLFIANWESPSVELLKLDFKKAGLFVYLPRSVVEFLHLNKEEDRSLVALMDYGGKYNYIILIADRDLVSLLKPIILSRREKAQQLQQELKQQLQVQRQQEAKEVEVIE